MTYDWRKARAALASFQAETGLQDFPWEKASGVGEGTLRRFRKGQNRSMGPSTYAKLATGAAQLLGRPVNPAQLRGEASLLRLVDVLGKVGAGAQVLPFAADGPIDQVEAPPRFEDGVALIVEGDSGAPMFHDGDVLFIGAGRRDVSAFIGKVAVVQVKGGPRLVKVILRGRKGTYDLLSINPAAGVLTDQPIAEVAAIEWIHRRT